MTKARTIADLGTGFVNISDTGTEGTKVASGTTEQRGSTAGQIRFNTTTGLAEYYDGTSFKSIDSPPTISSITPTSLGQSILGTSQTITITGSNFSSTVTVKIIGNDSTEYSPLTTTRNSNTQITITTPTTLTHTNEPYDIKVENISGLSNTLADCLSVNDTPVFSTASGSLGTLQDSNRSSTNLTSIVFADEESTPTVSVTSGTLPTGITLNSNGTWSGTANAVGSDTTYSFTVTATDGSESATRNYSITVNSPLSIDFLVIAGGGGGGGGIAGGGGAGGYRTSTQTVNGGTVITVTVGDGGTGTLGDGNRGNAGSDSSISGSGLTTITSAGGGGGGGATTSGGSGGSGGGGGAYQTGGAGNTPSQSPSQGNNGGAGTSGGFRGGAGGGGAGAVGNNGLSSQGGNGGNGLASSITGSSVTRAGGGGGGCDSGGANSTGGTGGGGSGTAGSVNGTAGYGTANTGGGGGGVGQNAGSANGSNGGKGVVILSMPTSKYSGTHTGSPTVTTSGSNTILQFNGSGSFTA